MKMKTLVFAIGLVGAASTAAWAQTTAVDADMYQATIDSLNQVADRFDTGLAANWADYVTVHGGAYVDVKTGNMNEDQPYAGQNTNRVSVTNAFLAVQATPNDWSTFDFTVNYSDASDSYQDTVANSSEDSIFVDQAYVTIGNSDRYPLFLQAGKQYVPFGHYELNPVVLSTSQVLSQTNRTDVQAGFVLPKGLYGSVYTFQNGVYQADDSSDSSKPMNYGATLGMKRSNDRMDVDMAVGYMDNMTGVDAVESALVRDTYNDTVAAMSAFVDFKTGPFGLKADYVTAMDEFSAADLYYDAHIAANGSGAKPSAGGVTASYDFNKRDMDQQVFVGYQTSSEASGLDLPETRYVLGYNVYPWSNVLVGAEITRDSDYDSGNVDSSGDWTDGDDYYTFNVRLGVQF